MNRRAFLGSLTGGLLAAPLAAEAEQAGHPYRIGFISMRSGLTTRSLMRSGAGCGSWATWKGRTSSLRFGMRAARLRSFQS